MPCQYGARNLRPGMTVRVRADAPRSVREIWGTDSVRLVSYHRSGSYLGGNGYWSVSSPSRIGGVSEIWENFIEEVRDGL